MSHILAMRFSALGDVAMTVPVIYSFAVHYPQHDITILTANRFSPLFDLMPKNVHFLGVDLSLYKGINGLNRLYKEVSATKFDAVADFHDVLRTKFIRTRFILDKKPISVIDKGRAEKRRLTRKHNKDFEQLLNSPERYARVLAELGFPTEISFRSIFNDKQENIEETEKIIGKKNGKYWIGIAPFAQHKGKIYPTELMEQVIEHFSRSNDTKIMLFGGGATERNICESWANKYDNTISLVGKSNLKTELDIINKLDVMLSMDSANMHLASIVGTTVISVWGATHPYAGFMGWNQSTDNAIQINMSCRPCSIYGKKPCLRGDYACLRDIAPKIIIERITDCLKKGKINASTQI